MTKRELQEKVLILEAQIHDIAKEAVDNGEELKTNPFIPEYLGFTETEIRDKDDLLAARVYSKDGYNISRYVDLSKPRWIIMEPNGHKNEVLINNMYNAIVILNACGMNISVKDYYALNEKMNDFIDGVQDELESPSFDEAEIIE